MHRHELQEAHVAESRRHNFRVLLIEDNQAVTRMIEQALRMAGHEVLSTMKGTDAFHLFELMKPDLIITDVILPEFDSLDAMAEFQRIGPSTKIIAISGNPHLLALAEKHGADYILAKPFGPGQLNALVKVALE